VRLTWRRVFSPAGSSVAAGAERAVPHQTVAGAGAARRPETRSRKWALTSKPPTRCVENDRL